MNEKLLLDEEHLRSGFAAWYFPRIASTLLG